MSECRRSKMHLQVLAGLLFGCYGAMALLARRFAYGSEPANRPVLLFVSLMTAGFVLHLIALRTAVRLRNCVGTGQLIFAAGIAFRVVLLVSEPILEVDIYRYMWDGMVCASGGNPYQFSPADVSRASADDVTVPEELRRLAALRDATETNGVVLSRVHFADLTTIYPPVSQAVFAAAAMVTPDRAPIGVRMLITKSSIVVFDVLTMLAILNLLKRFGKPQGWLICYAWSPLVLKEFANSGHLDAIAIALATGAVVLWLEGIRRADNARRSVGRLMTAAVLLGLGIGAKLYAVVLVPVVAVSVAKRVGWRAFALTAVILAAVSTVTLWPLLNPPEHEAAVAAKGELQAQLTHNVDHVVRSAVPEAGPAETEEAPAGRGRLQGQGLTAFVGQWEMNDFFFRLIVENLKPNSRAWFSVVPRTVRQRVLATVAVWLETPADQAAFLLARAILTAVLGAILLKLMLQAGVASTQRLAELAFLSIAWFWLLLPTMNPWYWTWAMPLLPFVRIRSWLLLSGCVVIYYTRFHLLSHADNAAGRFSGYDSRDFFRYVIVWLEYVPWLLLLGVEAARRRRRTTVRRARVA